MLYLVAAVVFAQTSMSIQLGGKEKQDSIAKAKNDSRLSAPTGVPGNGWHAFELSSSDDIRHALWWLREAHAFAGK